MKKSSFKNSFLAVSILLSINCYSQGWQKEFIKDNGKSSRNFNEIQTWAKVKFHHVEKELEEKIRRSGMAHEAESEEFSEYMQYKRWEWFWSNRVNPDGTLGALRYDWNAPPLRLKSNVFPEWERISFESNDGGYWGMGRAESIDFHPTIKKNYYVGSIGGGLWKTTDGGQSYTSIGDFLPLAQVGHILVDYLHPDTIYISMGPRGGWWTHNMGIYKSTDGGVTFNPTGLSYEYSDGKPVEDFVMNPFDPNVLLVSRKDGIFRSDDGAINWTKVQPGEFRDLVWRPGDTNIVYGVGYTSDSEEIYKSMDNGITWQEITSIGEAINTIKLTVTQANPNIIAYTSSHEDDAFYISYDNGGEFTKKSNVPENWEIYLSPFNEDIVYACGVNVHQSTDGGNNWTQISMWHGNTEYPEVHADVRNIGYNPLEQHVIYFCNDGGITKYNENTKVWTELDDGLVITQYYRLSCAQTDSMIVQGGTQDNGGNRRRSNGTWYNTNGGDAMEQAIDPTNANIMYTTYINGLLYRSNDGWKSNKYNSISDNIPGGTPNGSWVTPYKLDHNNSSVIVIGYDNVWRSTNKGNTGTWTNLSTNYSFGGTLNCLEIASSNSNVIYVSRGNILYKTSDLGKKWVSYTVPGPDRITRIAIHPANYDTVWISKGGFLKGSKVYKSVDGGENWVNISGSLPNIPINCIIYENGSNDGLYIGTDNAVYYRNETMSDWIEYNIGLPNTIVNDLDIHYGSKKLRAATYGRGIWEVPLFNASFPPEGNFLASSTFSCSGEIQFNDKSMYATSYKWDFGDGQTSSERNPFHTYESNGIYNVKLVLANEHGADSIEKNSYIEIDLFDSPVASGDSACMGESLKLNASASGKLFWHDMAHKGNLLYIGDTLSTPVLNTSTTYYVSNRSMSDTVFKGGPIDNSFGSGSNYTYTGHGLLFDVHETILLKSVKVYASGAANRTVELLDSSSNVIYSKTILIPDGSSRVSLNFVIEKGNQYFITCNGYTHLYRNSGGADYPYVISDLVSITETDVANSGYPNYYYFFYDWEVQEVGCESIRLPVEAKIFSDPDIGLYSGKSSEVLESKADITACIGDTILFNIQSVNKGWNWVGPNGFSAIGDTVKLDSIDQNNVGAYSATFTYGNSCEESYTFNLSLSTPDVPEIHLSGNELTLNSDYSAYQWFYENEAIEGANSKIYNAQFDGNYSVHVSDIYGCQEFSEKYYHEYTSIINFGSKSIKLFPNPTRGKIYLEISNNSEDIALQITNMNGKVVFHQVFPSGGGEVKTSIDMSNLSKGLYIAKLIYGKETRVRKISYQ